MKKLLVETPSAQLVNGYLAEISKAYGVKWTCSANPAVAEDEAGKLVGVASPVAVLLTGLLQDQTQFPDETPETLPSYSEEGPSVGKLPDLPPTEEEEEQSARKPGSNMKLAKENPEDDFESLTRRFRELKKG